MDKIIRITKSTNFGDLNSKKPIDIYEEQINSWLFRPLMQLAADKKDSFENGYAMLGLELLFFEPHGKYLSGGSISGSRNNFRFGLDSFLSYLIANKLIDQLTLKKVQATTFYQTSRCGIFHDMTIKSGLLIDSIHIEKLKVFYGSPIKNGILVSPWNLLSALKNYFDNYIKTLRNSAPTSTEYKNFEKTFKALFQY